MDACTRFAQEWAHQQPGIDGEEDPKALLLDAELFATDRFREGRGGPLPLVVYPLMTTQVPMDSFKPRSIQMALRGPQGTKRHGYGKGICMEEWGRQGWEKDEQECGG